MNTSMPPVDIKDPRIRVTAADVAMRIANDGPMYGVIILVGVLALKGTTTTLESIVGASLALHARSHPPSGVKFNGNVAAAVIAFVLMGALHMLSPRLFTHETVREAAQVFAVNAPKGSP